jgi:hypothetical protein
MVSNFIRVFGYRAVFTCPEGQYWEQPFLKKCNIMDISIDNKKMASQVKEEFNSGFPLLKIEFFRKGHIEGQANKKSDIISDDVMISDLSNGNEGVLKIGEHITVSELENAFSDRFGLNVQVFRRSGKIWLETTTTDHLTLKEQVELAAEKNEPVENVKPGDIDYD